MVNECNRLLQGKVCFEKAVMGHRVVVRGPRIESEPSRHWPHENCDDSVDRLPFCPLHLLDHHFRAGNFPSRSEAIAEAVVERSTRRLQADYSLLDPEDTKVWDVTLTDGLDHDAPRGD